MSHLKEAFDRVCLEAKPAEGWYVSLLEHEQYYGGPDAGPSMILILGDVGIVAIMG